jgi:tetratricopeptide (TPR) repeat protein
MKTPGVSIFVVVVLVLGVALAFYDYSKHGAREEQGKISKYEAYKLKNTKLLGAEESYKGDYEKAIKDYKAALKIAPRDAYLHNDLGTAFYYLGLKSINPPIKEDEFEFGIEVDARHLKKSKILPKVKEALDKTDSGIITAVMFDQDAKDEVVAFAHSLKYIVNVEEEK